MEENITFGLRYIEKSLKTAKNANFHHFGAMYGRRKLNLNKFEGTEDTQ